MISIRPNKPTQQRATQRSVTAPTTCKTCTAVRGALSTIAKFARGQKMRGTK